MPVNQGFFEIINHFLLKCYNNKIIDKTKIEGITMQNVRIYEMPACKMVSSGTGMFGEEKFNLFDNGYLHKKEAISERFPILGRKELCLVYMYEDGMNVPNQFEIIDFQGGLYAVVTDIDQKTDKKLMDIEIDKLLSINGFERDTSRSELGNIITSPHAKEIMGYEQMNYYIPTK